MGYDLAQRNRPNDAVGELIFHNRYSYANGNPVNFVDPSGMCWENSSTSPGQQAQCYDAWVEYLDKIEEQYPTHWPLDVVDLVYREGTYWKGLTYSDFVSQWNSNRSPASMTPNYAGDIAGGGISLAGTVSIANPFLGPEDAAAGVILVGGLCLAGIALVASALGAGAIALPNRPIIDFSSSSGTFTQTFPVVLESANFDWQTMERNAANTIERALPPGPITLLYRGKAMVNILKTTGLYEGRLWLSTSPSYITIYAHTDAAAEGDTAAIAIYGILDAALTALIGTGNVKPRFGLDYGFDTIAQAVLAGPVVIPIPEDFRG